tara:strand:+ start:12216 stop:12974 length:759 start_codon:yes stop_codon:yes gene_type:complete
MSVPGGADGLISSIDWDWFDLYVAGVESELTGAFELAFVGSEPGVPATVAHQRATAYAHQRAGELIGGDGSLSLTKMAHDDVAKIVGDGLARGDSIDKMSREIRASRAYSKTRADTIARTETATAIGEGGMSAAREAGKTQKRWMTARSLDVCPVCLENQERGWIGIVEGFTSGTSIPAHPNCRCDVIFRAEQAGGLAEFGEPGGPKMLDVSRCPNDGKLLKDSSHPENVELWCRRCRENVLPVSWKIAARR